MFSQGFKRIRLIYYFYGKKFQFQKFVAQKKLVLKLNFFNTFWYAN